MEVTILLGLGLIVLVGKVLKQSARMVDVENERDQLKSKLASKESELSHIYDELKISHHRNDKLEKELYSVQDRLVSIVSATSTPTPIYVPTTYSASIDEFIKDTLIIPDTDSTLEEQKDTSVIDWLEKKK